MTVFLIGVFRKFGLLILFLFLVFKFSIPFSYVIFFILFSYGLLKLHKELLVLRRLYEMNDFTIQGYNYYSRWPYRTLFKHFHGPFVWWRAIENGDVYEIFYIKCNNRGNELLYSEKNFKDRKSIVNLFERIGKDKSLKKKLMPIKYGKHNIDKDVYIKWNNDKIIDNQIQTLNIITSNKMLSMSTENKGKDETEEMYGRKMRALFFFQNLLETSIGKMLFKF